MLCKAASTLCLITVGVLPIFVLWPIPNKSQTYTRQIWIYYDAMHFMEGVHTLRIWIYTLLTVGSLSLYMHLHVIMIITGLASGTLAIRLALSVNIF